MADVTVNDPYPDEGWMESWQGKLNVMLGDWSQPTVEESITGITFSVPANPTFGEYFLVQTISLFAERKRFDGPYQIASGYGIDTTYLANSNDSPNVQIPDSYRSFELKESFETYLMYKHTANPLAIEVPLKRIAWQWGFVAVQDDPNDINPPDGKKWSVATYQSIASAVDTTSHPEWNDNFTAFKNDWHDDGG
jgi:hypothetical protein